MSDKEKIEALRSLLQASNDRLKHLMNYSAITKNKTTELLVLANDMMLGDKS